MKEIHKIRKKLHKERKGLTMHEVVLVINKNADELLRDIKKLKENQ